MGKVLNLWFEKMDELENDFNSGELSDDECKRRLALMFPDPDIAEEAYSVLCNLRKYGH